MSYGYLLCSVLIFSYGSKFIGNMLYSLYENSIRFGVRGYYYLNLTKGELNENDCGINKIESETIIVCNNYFKDILFKVNWKIIEFISLIREFNKRTLRPKFHELTDNYFRKPIKVISNGVEIYNFKNYEEAYNKIEKDEKSDYDFILNTKYHKTESKKNYTIISDKLSNDYKEIFDVCEVGFIYFQLKCSNNGEIQKYEINLKEPKNYLIKDNVLKTSFFKYYIKNIYNVDISDDFSIDYMTNDMSVSSLNNPFFIKFNEIGLTSFPMKKENVKEEEVDYKNDLISSIINQEKLKRQ